MISNRMFPSLKSFDEQNITYVMLNAFRLNYNVGIYEGLKHMNKGNNFNVFMYHIEEGDIQDVFFYEGVGNYRDIKTVDIELTSNINSLLDGVKGADILFVDQPYLKEEYLVLEALQSLDKQVILIEHNVSVPVQVVSNKEEYNARTIRPKIWRLLDEYRVNLPLVDEMFHYEKKANIDLNVFLDDRLTYYKNINEPSVDNRSHMSTYLKYGFISVNEMINRLIDYKDENVASFLEEVVVRRELAYNFIYYNKQYDDFDHITYSWAYETMNNHLLDKREYLYTLKDYLLFNTHDKYFNTAMMELIYTHDMHGYMRMYWAKKILEWSETYKEAYETIIYLNNHYSLDGNTPNGYTNIAWIFGKHDRAWKERSVFGKLRYMNKNGLERKFDMDGYVKRIEKKVNRYVSKT